MANKKAATKKFSSPATLEEILELARALNEELIDSDWIESQEDAERLEVSRLLDRLSGLRESPPRKRATVAWRLARIEAARVEVQCLDFEGTLIDYSPSKRKQHLDDALRHYLKRQTRELRATLAAFIVAGYGI
jgi:hypothetical protein